VGFGGHVSAVDLTLFTRDDLGVLDSAARELAEELRLPDADRTRLRRRQGLRLIGVLNDDSSSVGRRHFAFLLEYRTSGDGAWKTPTRGEKSITQLRWLQPRTAEIPLRNFEYWSQLVLRELFPRHVESQPSYRVRRRRPLKPPSILCVLGPAASGKSEATRVLTQEYGYHEINSGRVLASLLGIPPIPTTPRTAFQTRAWRFISTKRGPDRLASAIWQAVCATDSDRVLIDGIRQESTLQRLKALAGRRRLGIAFVHTPPDVAFRFYVTRFPAQPQLEHFLRIREAPVELEAASKMISLADAVLYNWSGLDAYRTTVRHLMTNLGVDRQN